MNANISTEMINKYNEGELWKVSEIPEKGFGVLAKTFIPEGLITLFEYF